MSVTNISHKGKKILYADFTDIKDQELLLKEGLEAARILKESKEKMLLLVNFNGTSVGAEFMSSIKVEGKYILKNIPLTSAMIGITKLKKIMIKGYVRVTGSKLRVFDTLLEAKEYLANS